MRAEVGGQQAAARQAQELEQMAFIPKCWWISAVTRVGNCGILGKCEAIRLLASSSQHASLVPHSEECHKRKIDCFIAYAYSMVGMVESGSDSRMEQKTVQNGMLLKDVTGCFFLKSTITM